MYLSGNKCISANNVQTQLHRCRSSACYPLCQKDSFTHIYMYICIYTYLYTYSHPQIVSFVVSKLSSVARHIGHLKLGSKSAKLFVILSIILLSQLANHLSSEIIRYYRLFTFLSYRIPECSIHSNIYIYLQLHQITLSIRFCHSLIIELNASLFIIITFISIFVSHSHQHKLIFIYFPFFLPISEWQDSRNHLRILAYLNSVVVW